MLTFFKLTAVICLCLIIPIYGNEEPCHPLQLDGLIYEVINRNPDLAATRDRIEAAALAVGRVQVLDDPDLAVQSEENPFHRPTIDFTPMVNVEIAQRIPFPGKLRLKGKIAHQQLLISQSQELTTLQDLVLQTKKLYYLLIVNRNAFQINHQNREIIQKVIGAAMAFYESGQGNYAEVLKGQIELQTVEEEQLGLTAEKEMIIALINALLNQDPYCPLGEPIETFDMTPFVSFDFCQLETLAFQERPEIHQTEAMIGEEMFRAKLARRGYFPDFVVSGMYQRMTDTRENGWGATVGINLPIWIALKQRREVQEALARAKANENTLRSMRAMIRSKIREITAALKASEEKILLYQTGLLPKTRQALSSLEAKYRSGEGEFLMLLDTRRQLQNFEMEYVRKMAERATLLAELERTIGVPLEMMKCTVNN